MGNDADSLPSGWKMVTFSDLLIGGVRNGVYKPKQFHGYGVKIVNMGELFAYPRLSSVDMKRVQLTEDEKVKNSLMGGDLIFARRSLVAEGAGKCCIVCEVDEPTTYESSIIRARPNPDLADSYFLYYFFNSPLGKHLLDTIRRQVAVSGITGTDLIDLRLPIPEIDEQHRIASIFCALDDKIELNHCMNGTLEAIARALFKSWFVDFDPVRAKAEGKQPFGMAEETAVLFPSEFEDSELGEIPKGWSTSSLYNLADYVNGDAFRPEDFGDEGIPIIKIAELKNGITDTTKRFFGDTGKLVKIGDKDILFSWSGNPETSIDIFIWNRGNAILNQHIFKVIPKNPDMRNYIYLLLKNLKPLFKSIASNKQTTGLGHVTVRDLKEITIINPSNQIMSAFNNLISPFIELIFINNIQNMILEKLRDTLLPKLISGEICLMGSEIDNLQAESDVSTCIK